MKNKKLLAAIVAVTMSASTAVAFSGCNTDKHQHDFTDWTVTTPATCTENGVETGTCKTDGVTEERVLPKLGHKYGSWEITEPTADTDGSATKTCGNDKENAHPINVTLPKLTDESSYKVQHLKDTPTYSENKYTYEHTSGDIVFTAYKNKKDVSLTVGQAVETANDSRYSALVGKGEGSTSTNSYSTDFLYEFGENYTHTKGDVEYWLDKDAEGAISGIYYDGYAYRLANENDADVFAGYRLTNPFNYEICYGAEALLASLYATATETNEVYNTQFSEKFENGVYSFSWTVVKTSYNESAPGEENRAEISNASVEFTLESSYMLKSLSYSCRSYNYIYGKNAQTPFNFDETEKTYSPKPGKDPDSVKTISVNQTALSGLDKTPENPWNFDEITIKSFNLKYGHEVSKEAFDAVPDDDPDVEKEILGGFEDSYLLKYRLAEGSTVDLTTAENIDIFLTDFAPESAGEYISLNPVKVYVLKDGEETLIASSEEFVYSTELSAYYDNTRASVNLRSRQQAGDFDVKICVGEVSKTFKLHVTAAAPEEIVTKVNVYNDSKDTYDEKKADSVTIFKNQTLTFKTDAGDFEDPYNLYLYDAGATVTFEATEKATLTETGGVYSFVATETGEYVINVVSDLNSELTCTLTITVKEIPDVSASLDGSYTAGGFTLTFDNAANTVTVTDGADVNQVINYTYTDGRLTAISSDGKFSVVLTENYKLVLVYKDDFDETKRAVLKESAGGMVSDDVKAALAGTWKGKFTDSYGGTYNIVIVLNVDGTATFSDGMGMGADQLTYELEANGNGTFNIVFSSGLFTGYFGVAEEGSSFSSDGSSVTEMTFGIFDTMDPDTVTGMTATKQ